MLWISAQLVPSDSLHAPPFNHVQVVQTVFLHTSWLCNLWCWCQKKSELVVLKRKPPLFLSHIISTHPSIPSAPKQMLFSWIAFGSGKCFACKVVRSWKSRNPKEEVYLETCQHCVWDFLFGPATKCCHTVVTCCVAKSHFSYDLSEVQGILTKYNLWMHPSQRQSSRPVTFVELSAPRCWKGHRVVPKLDENLQSFLICDVDD